MISNGKSRKMPSTGCFEGLSTFLSHWEDSWLLGSPQTMIYGAIGLVKLFIIIFWILIQWRYFLIMVFIFTIFVMFSPYAKKEKISLQNFAPQKKKKIIMFPPWKIISSDILFWEPFYLFIQNVQLFCNCGDENYVRYFVPTESVSRLT